jgi:hypothetical protein
LLGSRGNLKLRTPIKDAVTENPHNAAEAKAATEKSRSWLPSAAALPAPNSDLIAPSTPDARSSSPRNPPAASEGACLFLTEAQVAARWGVSPYSVYEMRRRGVGPAFNIFGRAAVRYSIAAIQAFERSEAFQSMTEVYSRRAGRARARASHGRILKRAREALAEGRDRV